MHIVQFVSIENFLLVEVVKVEVVAQIFEVVVGEGLEIEVVVESQWKGLPAKRRRQRQETRAAAGVRSSHGIVQCRVEGAFK